MDSGKGHLERFCRISVPGGKQGKTPGTLSEENRARWEAGKDTWHTFAGIPCQVGGGKRHLERFCRNSVPGGQREETPGTLLQRNRARWEAGKDTWHAFAGKPWQVGSGKGTPDTLLRENRSRWTAGRDTWNDFAGIPWQVGGGKGYLERFCGDTVAGGRRERLPGTLLRENRGRWAAGRCHLEHFCGDSVPGGRRERTPDTLSREYSATLPGGKFYWDMKLNLY